MTNSTKSRLARKAARLEKDENERQFDAALGAAKRELQATLTAANNEYQDGVKELDAKRAETRKEANRVFIEKRNLIVAHHAKVERSAS